jgi:hypothetical protein
MRLNQIIIAAATLATLASGCGTPQTGGTKIECDSDNDCKRSEVCLPDKDIAGMKSCQTPANTAPQCKSDNDCKRSEVCDTGSGQCKTGGAGPQCRVDNDCKSGERCETGSCKPTGPNNPDGFTCRADQWDVEVSAPTGKNWEPRVMYAEDPAGASGTQYQKPYTARVCLSKKQICDNAVLEGYTQGMSANQIAGLKKSPALEFAARGWNPGTDGKGFATDEWIGCNSAESLNDLIVKIKGARNTSGVTTRLPQACAGGGQGNLVIRATNIPGLNCN